MSINQHITGNYMHGLLVAAEHAFQLPSVMRESVRSMIAAINIGLCVFKIYRPSLYDILLVQKFVWFSVTVQLYD
jgi:hypothetical protein